MNRFQGARPATVAMIKAKVHELLDEIERLKEALHWWQSVEQVRLRAEIERLRGEQREREAKGEEE